MGATSSLNSATLLQFIRQGRSFSGHEPHCSFLNVGQTQFANISSVSGLDFQDDGRAVGITDWDQDGDVDLWVSNRSGPQLRYLQNDLGIEHASLSIRLQGTQCNRDAIGARVEVVTGNPALKLIKSLRAGDGYLAQSSKWLHFGLGDHADNVNVVVQWPDGQSETFQSLRPGRYVLKQGSAAATAWTGPGGSPETHSHTVTTTARTGSDESAAQVFCVSQLPVPRLAYEGFDGQVAEVFRPGSGKPVLLNLWASWCLPCQQEVAGLATAQRSIESAGLDVVALSVDGLDGNNSISAAQLEAMLSDLRFPFRSGRASAKLIELVQILNDYSFDLHLPLPVPTSILIDGEGRLAALYKGPVDAERILADVALLGADLNTQRDRTTGFAGRWHESLKTVSLVPLLDMLTERGFLAEANEYVARIGTVSKGLLLPALTRLGIACYRQGLNGEAQRHFNVIQQIDPSFVGAQTQLGKLYEQQGRYETAVKLYSEAIERNPSSLTALNNLAWLLATCPDPQVHDGEAAVKHATQANELTSGVDPNVLDTLAAAHARAGDFSNARETAEKAWQLAQSTGRLQLAAQIATRIDLYRAEMPFLRSQ